VDFIETQPQHLVGVSSHGKNYRPIYVS
jgi:hypothetical protein